MAITPLSMISWEYDDSIAPYGEVSAKFIDVAPADDPDPAGYVPTISIVMRLPLSQPITRTDLPPAAPPPPVDTPPAEPAA